MSRELVSSEWLDTRIAERAALERKLAEVTSERDWLRERMRELVETFEVNASTREQQGNAPMGASWRAAAAWLRQVVAESEGSGNETAT